MMISLFALIRPVSLLMAMWLLTNVALAAPLLQRAKPEEQKQMNEGIELNRAEIGRVRYDLQQQINTLQMEVQRLRGIVEEQNHAIEQLKKGERERYVDLDKRLRDLQQRLSGSAASPSLAVTANTLSEDEKTYQSAKQKLDDKEFNAALAEFMLYLEFFPEGQFVAQTHYWMGELYMSLEIPEYDNAEKHFMTVIKNYPDHAKVAGCYYKLGLVYKAQNRNDEARQQFKTLIDKFPDSSTASLAKTQIDSL